MRIGIDVSQIAYPGSGVARYVRNLLDVLIEYDAKNEYVLFFSSLRQRFPDDLRNKLPENFTLKEFRLPPLLLDILWNKFHILPIENFIGDIDIFYTSDWTEPPAKKAKKITTIHDLIVYKYPETSTQQIIDVQKRKLAHVKKESTLILCDSKATEDDVNDILKIPKDKLHVLYPYVEMKMSEEKMDLKKPYILSVGKIEPRKNIARLILAFNELQLKDYHLYIVGPKGWNSQINNADGSISFLGYVSDGQLAYLYKNAECFIFPSLYEGFGYPVVEAMSFGCPVGVSQTSSVGEIAKDAGLLFYPEYESEIKQTIKELVTNKKTREKLSVLGKKRAKDFSKDAFAKELLSVFESLQ